jgi:hypothetical protein
MKKIMIIFCLLGFVQLAQAQQHNLRTWPIMDWAKEFWWPDIKPQYNVPPGTNQQFLNQPQTSSGEDWLYKVIKGDALNNAFFGYASGKKATYGQGCTADKLAQKGATIVKLDANGNLLWQKLMAQISVDRDQSMSIADDDKSEGIEKFRFKWEDSEFHSGMLSTETIIENGQPVQKDFYIAVGFTAIVDTFPYNKINAAMPDPLQKQIDPVENKWSNVRCEEGNVKVFRHWENSKRLVYVVKVDAQNGDIIWQHTYNVIDPADYGANKCDNFRAMGWGIELLPNGNYLIAGCAPSSDPADQQDINRLNKKDLDKTVTPNRYTYASTRTIKAMLMEIEPDGTRKWIKTYSPVPGAGATGTNYQSVAYAIKRRGNTNEYVIAGRVQTDPAWRDPIMAGSPTRGRAYIGTFTCNGGGTTGPAITFNRLDNAFDNRIDNSLNALISDITIDEDNNIIVPLISNCTECYDTWNGDAIARVIKIPYAGGTSTISKGFKVRAYDLRMGITTWKQGGQNSYAIVSTINPNKQYNEVTIQSTTDFLNDNAYSGSDAFIATLNENLNITNFLSFDSYTLKGRCPDDWKEQECVYSIVHRSENGLDKFVICGNTSSNADDHYVVKTQLGCQSTPTILPNVNDRVTIERNNSYALESPTSGTPAYTAGITGNENTGEVVLRAGNYIHLKDGFMSATANATNNPYMHAYIDNLSCDYSLILVDP